METIYKIHPAIGIARVGKSNDGFFLESDDLNGSPYEIDQTGDIAFKGYKDSNYQIRKQGVRFKVHSYTRDEATGTETYVGPVDPDQVKIAWKVSLGNGKSAGHKMTEGTGLQGEKVIIPNFSAFRNAGIADRDRLFSKAQSSPIKGNNQPFQDLRGSIMDKSISLGEAGTDNKGNLIVVGSTGESFSWNTPADPIGNFLNNDSWYDTTADGTVDAVLEFNNGDVVTVQKGSWVLITPPDFAPGILPIVSLWDMMYDSLVRKGRLQKDPVVSYEKHIKPVIEKAASYRWVNASSIWGKIQSVLSAHDLSDSSAATKAFRSQVLQAIEGNPLLNFKLSPTQVQYFNDWVAGNFQKSTPDTPTEKQLSYQIDKVALTRAIGTGFYPGIEMGFMATNGDMYDEPFRITRNSFTDMNGAAITLLPGMIIQRMACPWQADFMECAETWWPAQRPDLTKYKQDGSMQDIPWDRGIVVGAVDTVESHANMVKYYSDLGVVQEITVNGKDIFVEEGRNPAIPS